LISALANLYSHSFSHRNKYTKDPTNNELQTQIHKKLYDVVIIMICPPRYFLIELSSIQFYFSHVLVFNTNAHLPTTQELKWHHILVICPVTIWLTPLWFCRDWETFSRGILSLLLLTISPCAFVGVLLSRILRIFSQWEPTCPRQLVYFYQFTTFSSIPSSTEFCCHS
jgi:hypothetical protein